MSKKVLLSIKPEYATKIFNGEKGYEFRRSIFKDEDVDVVVVYATMPVGKIIGEFTIDKIICDSPDAIWDITENRSGISKEFFESYYTNRNVAYAIQVGEVTPYNPPVDPYASGNNFKPPQSFFYIRD